MAIKKPPTNVEIEKFINNAPDGKKTARFRRGNKVQITLTIDETILDQIDSMAKRMGLSRAALVSIALGQVLESGVKIGNT
jgi:hypothetical protein